VYAYRNAPPCQCVHTYQDPSVHDSSTLPVFGTPSPHEYPGISSSSVMSARGSFGSPEES